MKFFFTTDGFPGVVGTKSGSGIGTFLFGLSRGLTERGHECHVLTWGDSKTPRLQDVDGVRVHQMTRGHYRLGDRLNPGWADVTTRRVAARALDAAHEFDWVEIESDEGIDVGIQRDLPGRSLLRVHTKLRRMVEH